MYDNEEGDIRIVHNSTASRHGLILCVDVEFSRRICPGTEREIMEWLCTGLEAAHRELDPDNLWHYVYGVRHDQWSDADGNRQVNGLQVTLHFAKDLDDGYLWPLFSDEPVPRLSIDVADVVQKIGPAPAYVRSLGVSAVQERCLSREWLKTVSAEPESFCRVGSGIGAHTMYTLHRYAHTPNPLESAEMSRTFGWHEACGRAL